MNRTLYLAFFLTTNAIASASGPMYSVTVLPPSAGLSSSSAVAIDNQGNVMVDSCFFQTAVNFGAYMGSSPYIYNTLKGTTTALTTPDGGAYEGFGVGGGFALIQGSSGTNYRYNISTGTYQALGISSGPGGFAYRMNQNGDAVGIVGEQNHELPTVWKVGSAQPTIFYPKVADSADVEMVNDNGEVLGVDQDGIDQSWVASNYSTNGGANTKYVTLTNPTGSKLSTGLVLNDTGEVAGISDLGTVLWNYGSNGVTSQIIASGSSQFKPTAINNDGEIVGNTNMDFDSTNSAWSSGAPDAVEVYVNGNEYNLSDQIATITQGYAGYTPEEAWGLNDEGQIVGTLTNAAGDKLAFIATPLATPEPASFLPLGLGVLVLFRRSKKIR